MELSNAYQISLLSLSVGSESVYISLIIYLILAPIRVYWLLEIIIKYGIHVMNIK